MRRKPSIWYIAAGYSLPAGIEAYLLHYATEMGERGFGCRIIVFDRLPKVEHRYLKALRERGIPIESLRERVEWPARLLTALLWLPWLLRGWLVKGRRGDGTPDGGRRMGPRSDRPTRSWERLRYAILKRLEVRRLASMIKAERPDVIHVKGRVIVEALAVLPPERTIYQHALSGTVDPSWDARELEAFRAFANHIARVFVQGTGIAQTMAREYGLDRPIDIVFTMAPDERGRTGAEGRARSADAGPIRNEEPRPGNHSPGALRFGILCRFTEQKGIRFILEALRRYHERHGDVRFTFAGQGPLEELIRATVDKERWKNVVLRRVESASQIMDELDVFVHPGLDDAMPVSVVEALMCSVPCIGTKVGGLPDLIRDGVEGFLVEPSSADAIHDAMERFASMSGDELQAYRQRSRARYEECCLPRKVGAIVAKHYLDVIHEATNPRAAMI